MARFIGRWMTGLLVGILLLESCSCERCASEADRQGSGFRLLLLGGMDPAQTYSLVYTKQGTPDAPWRPAPALPIPLRGHAAVAVEGAVILAGGATSDQDYTSQVISARLAGDGLEGWRQEEPLPRPLAYHAAALGSGWLFLSGGQGPEDSNAVYVAKLQSDGRLGQWQVAGYLPVAMRGHGTFVHGGRLFVLGGHNQAAFFSQVYSATIGQRGDLDSWKEEPPLPRPLVHFAVVIHGNQALVLGGQDEQAFLTDQIWSASLKGGRLGPWQALKALPVDDARMTATAVGDSLVITGGGYGFMQPVHDEIWRADFTSSGDLGEWQQVGRLPVPLAFHQVVVW